MHFKYYRKTQIIANLLIGSMLLHSCSYREEEVSMKLNAKNFLTIGALSLMSFSTESPFIDSIVPISLSSLDSDFNESLVYMGDYFPHTLFTYAQDALAVYNFSDTESICQIEKNLSKKCKDNNSGYKKHKKTSKKGKVENPYTDLLFSKTLQLFIIAAKYLDYQLLQLFQILPLAQAANIGQIGYFEGPCPDGWSDYLQLHGKFILSAGSGYNVNATGGEAEHTLTVDEMPSHQHKQGSVGILNAFGGGIPGNSRDFDSGPYTAYFEALTSSTGGSKPHNNMPPYFVLRACKKIREDEFTNITAELANLKSAMDAQKANMTSEIASLKATLEAHKNSESSVTLGLGIAAIVCSIVVPVTIEIVKKCRCVVQWLNQSGKKYEASENDMNVSGTIKEIK
jgi:hypothetical protein